MFFIYLLLFAQLCFVYAEEADEAAPELEKEDVPNEEVPTEEEDVPKENVPKKDLPPHVIFFLADDLGWNDVSFHGSPQIPTPNIDALASSSLILNNYYTESECTPARAALLTGKYPIYIGLQHSSIKNGEPTALPLEIKIMPEQLKNKGYVAHMVGKWNLGYARKENTPLYRGFDSFFGFYNEKIDYYDYTSFEKSDDSKVSALYGVDLQNGTSPIKDFRGEYATNVFTQKAVDIIMNHNDSYPLFLYISHLACHSGNEYMSLQAPVNLVAKYSHIKDKKRKTYAGVVSALDDSVAKIVDTLNNRNFLHNSIIVFTSDNGGNGNLKGGSSNWPLRGTKGYSWEGALRVPCFVWSPLLGLKEPRTSMQLMHVSDWLPTLYSAAGGDVADLGNIDGYDMWKVFLNNQPSPRIEILHNIDPIYGIAALRRGDYKLVLGTAPGSSDLWYGSSGFEDIENLASMDEWVFKNGSAVMNILQKLEFWQPKSPDSWRINATVQCSQPPPTDNGGCDPNKSPCLFNVAADPCEYNNLASRYPRIVRSMIGILAKYNVTAVYPLSTFNDPRADPRCHGFTYVSWMDEEYASECPF